MIEDDNIKQAIIDASINKKKQKYVKQVLDNIDNYIPYYRQLAYTYIHKYHKPKIIIDGIKKKEREIIRPYFDEQVLHHMIINILKPIILKGMYKYTFGSLPNRGQSQGKKIIIKWRKHNHNIKYCCKLDIKKFFPSIDHTMLKNFLSNKIHDTKFLRLLFEIIDCTDEGLPLGFYTSHWLAHWLLQSLDHYIKEKLKAKHFHRFMDDMVLFCNNKKTLHKIKDSIKLYLMTHYNLSLKENWQIFRFNYKTINNKDYGRDLDYMGYRFFKNRTLLRKSMMLKMTRKARKISKKIRFSIYDCRQMLSSLGWLKQTNSYKVYINHIKPFIKFYKLRKYMSNYDKLRRVFING